MANKTIAVLKSDADSYINDNATRDISPSDIRERIKDLADSSINRTDDKLLLNLRTYVTTRAYEVGEHCELSLTIYKCTTATSGVFNPAHWTAVIGPESMSLTQLSDVTLTAPSLNQVLQYNGSQWVNATFSAGISSLNGLTGGTQTFTTGTTGTDFGIVSSGTTHTFNLPTASGTNRGALSSADWTTFNNKFTLPALTSGSILFSDGSTIAQDNANLFWDDSNNRLGIRTNSPTATFHLLGSGTTNATYATKIQGNGGAALVHIKDNGHIGFGIDANNSYKWYFKESDGFDMVRMDSYLTSNVFYINYLGRVGLRTGSPRNIFDVRIEGDTNTSQLAYGFEAIGAIWQNTTATNNNWTSLQFRTSTGTVSAYIDVQNTNHAATEGNLVFHANYNAGSGGNIFFGNISSSTNGSYYNTGTFSWMIGKNNVAIDGSALMQFESTTKGVLFPRMTATQASAITAVDGLVLYVTNTNVTFTAVGLWCYVGGAWTQL